MEIFIVLNGQAAGPFNEEQARTMLTAGQATPETLSCPVGDQNWRPLGEVLGSAAAAVPLTPAMPLAPYAGGFPPGAMGMPVTNGLAITALVLGCASVACSCLTSIPAIICGHIALGQINRSQGTQAGRGLAIGGLVIGYVMTGLLVLYFIVIALFGVAGFASQGR